MPAGSFADYAPLEATLFQRSHVAGLTAMVAGAGALGNEVARQLGLLGLAQVVLVDPDRVEAGNLPRSFFFWDPGSLGRNKAAALAAAASPRFPGTKWLARETEIADVAYRAIGAADILFSCVDSDLARFEIAYLAKQAGVLVADAGLGRDDVSFGRVSMFPASADTACYGCLLGPRKRRALLETWHSTLQSCVDPGPEAQASASTPTMAALVAAMQVEIGLRTLIDLRRGLPVGSRSVEIRLHPERRLTEFTTDVSVACPFHEIDRAARHHMPRPDATFGDLLASAGAGAVVLEWPICAKARCLDCNVEWTPFVRLATLRRRGRCPSCGSASLLELDVLRSITSDSAWAAMTPAAVGISPEQSFHLQGSGWSA